LGLSTSAPIRKDMIAKAKKDFEYNTKNFNSLPMCVFFPANYQSVIFIIENIFALYWL
jgi:hypothetical protein